MATAHSCTSHENVLGSSLELKVVDLGPAAATAAETAALAEIDRLSKVLSAWDSTSEFSRWTRTHNQAVEVSPELFQVLSLYDRLRMLAGGNDISNSVSSATRPPGRYTLKWDGKDNKEKQVKAGKYTVCIEAAREHGTYQILRQEMEFTGTPKQVQLPGNTEIESASLDYRKIIR